ncbi:exopolyphosphatase [Edwardsiella piscicida]|uniref:Exopolyphosphatase n=3 Tax=Edwardsiella TaxID=635 RepID=A0A0H3DP10_EDWTF|nr:exopolyphosphatase [Edwardsiella piscicida]ACY83927.1 exopolyphosphatase [Edwardsiella tarda EIB202]ADM41128.1 Exopolyphosphatase [Edwardsiella tarda FL6-60]ARD17311.1 exopolyphosphatase [Edwardsiella piscicida]MDM3863800.1 exopolyphosphatase [Edwardsiella piscicida]QHR96605.1 exopolyphosphatase [Edwardsiella piscicida]
MPLIPTSPRPQEIAAVDLGSNSFHMVIARVVNGALQVLGRLKQRVHLADGLDQHQCLSEESMARGLACLALFAERLQGFPAENVCIVGTHTLRQANNAQEFLKRAAKVIPYPIEIISGHEEARLIFMGVAHTQPEKGRKLVIDIGGGSTEMVIGEDFDPILVESRRMGCVSFAQQFFTGGVISAAGFQRARLAAAQKLENMAWQYRIQGWSAALGASGSIKAAYEVLVAMGEKDGLLTPARLAMLCDEVLRYDHVDRLRLPGLSEDRRQVFVPGLAILCGVFDALAIKQLRLSDGALREGVLYEMEGRFRHQDIRSRTALSLAEHYNIDREQAQRVQASAQQLYAQWMVQNPRLVHPQLEALLNWAAALHEVGLSINHSGMQRHSAYILQNTNLPGFTQEQQLMLATLVRCQRKALRLEELPRFTLFKKKQYLPLIQILRLATLLNNQRQSTAPPATLQLETHGFQWVLRFPSHYLRQNSLVQLDVEKEQAYWRSVDGWSLVIEAQLED